MPLARLQPRTAALLGSGLAWTGFAVLVLGGYGGEGAACPDSPPALVGALAVVCALVASVGFGLAVWAYRATAGEPSAEWLLGAAGLYVGALGWIGALAGAAALLAVDLCAL